MHVFLGVMVAGLLGLVLMALPGLGRHGHGLFRHGAQPHALHGGGHGLRAGGHALHRGAHPRLPAGATHPAPHGAAETGAAMLPARGLQYIPTPQSLFSLMALYGAFGMALLQPASFSFAAAALVAVIPSVLIERLALTPFWDFLFRFEGQPSSPLESLLLDEAVAVTPFRNGKGMVRVVRDGRSVQLPARLTKTEAGLSVDVGDRLRIQDVDPTREWVTVSVE